MRKIYFLYLVLFLWGTTYSQIINEFQPNPFGSDPITQNVELKGLANAPFSLWLISIEGDTSNSVIDSASMVTGTFDTNGLAVVSISDLENPSFTFVLCDNFTGLVGDDLDANNDGTLETSTLGNVLDAIGIPDSTTDEARIYGAQLGGADFGYTGDEPALVFRDGVTNAWYALNDSAPNQAITIDGTTSIPTSDFNIEPSFSGTFGTTNPSSGTIIINEFQPNPFGSDSATQNVELKGASPNTPFSLWLISIEGDTSNSVIDSASMVTGTFDANGLAVVSIPDLENPSFTFVLCNNFTGSTGDNLDANNDGTLETNTLGNVLDAIGIPDSITDEARIYGAQLGGADFGYTGDEPALVFRDGVTNAWYALNDPTFNQAIAIDGSTSTALSDFNVEPFSSGTFGSVNPTTETTLSINNSTNLKFSIFPNPTNTGEVNISSVNASSIAITVFDVLGKQVKNETISNNRLNVSNLKPGMYLLRLTQDGTTSTKKLVIR